MLYTYELSYEKVFVASGTGCPKGQREATIVASSSDAMLLNRQEELHEPGNFQAVT
jgi:hypothetical protein